MSYLFKFCASAYDPFMRFFHLDRYDGILMEMRIVKGKRILDIDGGTGILADILQRRGADVFLADPEKNMTAIAMRRNPHIRIIHTPVKELNLTGASFDYIVLRDTLHHIPQQADVFRKAHRLLSSGGKLLIQEFDRKTWHCKWIWLLETLCFERCRMLSEEQLLHLGTRYFKKSSVKRNGNFELLYIGEK